LDYDWAQNRRRLTRPAPVASQATSLLPSSPLTLSLPSFLSNRQLVRHVPHLRPQDYSPIGVSDSPKSDGRSSRPSNSLPTCVLAIPSQSRQILVKNSAGLPPSPVWSVVQGWEVDAYLESLLIPESPGALAQTLLQPARDLLRLLMASSKDNLNWVDSQYQLGRRICDLQGAAVVRAGISTQRGGLPMIALVGTYKIPYLQGSFPTTAMYSIAKCETVKGDETRNTAVRMPSWERQEPMPLK